MRLPRTTTFLLVLSSIFAGHEARAQGVITVCQNIIGKTVSPPAHWDNDDGLTDGSVTVLRNGSRYDLIIKDAKATFSALSDGATITKLDGDSDEDFTLALAYPLGQVEVYRFRLDATGRGVMLYAMLTNRAKRGALFDAKCSRANS
jgi:hypothetical protein